jgi:hypothetical protein
VKVELSPAAPLNWPRFVNQSLVPAILALVLVSAGGTMTAWKIT